MAKSRIIKELANNEISLDVALSRLIIIASDIANEELLKWAELELNGYNGETVPDYRIAKTTVVKYSGINGVFQVTNQPLPLQEICCNDSPELLYVNITDSIGALEKCMAGEERNKMCRDLTFLAGSVYKKTGIKCTSIKQHIPANAFENIINTIKTILMKTFLKLEKTYGCLDDLDINLDDFVVTDIEETNKAIYNYIYEDKSITIGDGNKINDAAISGGK